MFVFYCINLVKLEIFWLHEKVEMTYNLVRSEYLAPAPFFITHSMIIWLKSSSCSLYTSGLDMNSVLPLTILTHLVKIQIVQ
jgi:hypothetical protein